MLRGLADTDDPAQSVAVEFAWLEALSIAKSFGDPEDGDARPQPELTPRPSAALEALVKSEGSHPVISRDKSDD